MSESTTILGLTVGMVTGNDIDPSHVDRPSRYLENLANVVLAKLFGDGVINRSVNTPVVNGTTKRITAPTAGDPLIGLCNGKPFVMPSTMEVTGAAQSGNTTSMVDTNRAEAAGFWIDGYLIFTSGSNAGAVRQVTNSTALGVISWETALSNAVAASDGYVLTMFYVQGLTNSAVNYVYGRALARTAPNAVIQWVANTSGVTTAGDFLVATVTLDGSGVVTASDNAPEGAARDFWTGAGQVHQLELTGTIASLSAGASVDITRSHDELLLFGPVEVSTDDPDVTGVVTTGSGWDKDSITVTFTNGGSYASNVAYTIIRWGRKKIQL